MFKSIKTIAIAAVFTALAGRGQAASLTIVPTFDTSITSLANAAAVESTIKTAIGIYQTSIVNPITLNITFRNVTAGVGQSAYNNYVVSYSNYINALNASKTSPSDTTALAHLPLGAANPINSGTSVLLRSASAKALGLGTIIGLAAGASDGTVSVNVAQMNVTRTGIQNPKFYDLQTVLLHEINEVLGLGSTMGQGLTAPYSSYPSPEDLFRYDSAGKRSFTTGTRTAVWFSLDGKTHLDQFNNAGGGDYGDWANSATVQVQDVSGTVGKQANLGVELRALDVIGYTLAAALRQ